MISPVNWVDCPEGPHSVTRDSTPDPSASEAFARDLVDEPLSTFRGRLRVA